jgi:CRISPR-associated protein Csm1
MPQQTLNATCRVALAALLHDLGKFAERARIDCDPERLATWKQLDCPQWDGRPTHIHAAYTTAGFTGIESFLPPREQLLAEPFAGFSEPDADDSLINAAARHHKPSTFLQWIIATADRLASGFERSEWDAYNRAEERTSTGRNHYQARLLSLFESIQLDDDRRPASADFCLPLKPLSPAALFPRKRAEIEPAEDAPAREEYKDLWQQFTQALQDIPASHRQNLPLWLDHFDSAWLAYTHAIPSATAGGTRPDVSLYDHSKAVAALAVALWRWHEAMNETGADAVAALKDRTDWETEKFLLVQGDFSGIQDFIFAGGQSQRHVAKLLRGRSFYVSLLTELAALKVLDALALPSTSQVINAAGKFLIVAPNTEEAINQLRTVQAELNAWFLQHTWGQSGINLAWLPACASHFRQTAGESPFRALIKRLFEQLETAKLRRFDLCGATPPSPLFEGALDRYTHGECRIDGQSPAHPELEGMSELAWDQVQTGKWLAHQDRLLITRTRIEPREGQTLHQLRLPIFGYHVLFTGDEEITGKFGEDARSGNLLRAWDFSLPQAADAPLWNGYARRAINAFVPRFGEMNEWEAERYRGLEKLEDFEPEPGAPKTLEHLARDDRWLDEHGRWVGVEAIMTLKGDIDNLGLIFQQGIERPTFARMAALSRQINAFFTVWLPWVCRSEFPNTYTVFAGGDDFFLIGPWRSTMRLAQRMRQEFARFVAENPDIHFSVGLSMTKPGLPIRHLRQLAEDALDDAKAHNPKKLATPPKNAVSCFRQTVFWPNFEELMGCEARLKEIAQEMELSTGYLYGLMHLTEMAADTSRPENALWYSRFAYRTRRLLETKIRNLGNPQAAERRRRDLQERLAAEIVTQGIEPHRAAYKIALFTHLYQQRHQRD